MKFYSIRSPRSNATKWSDFFLHSKWGISCEQFLVTVGQPPHIHFLGETNSFFPLFLWEPQTVSRKVNFKGTTFSNRFRYFYLTVCIYSCVCGKVKNSWLIFCNEVKTTFSYNFMITNRKVVWWSMINTMHIKYMTGFFLVNNKFHWIEPSIVKLNFESQVQLIWEN